MGEHQILAAQDGVISRRQAIAAGMSDATIRRRVTSCAWARVFPGVYRHTAPVVDDRLMLRAAVLWLGPQAVVSGSWAAWWHGLCAEPSGPIGLTMPRVTGSRRQRHVRVRRRDLDPADIVVVDRLRLTSRALTALENAAFPHGDDVFDRALQRHVSVHQLTDSLGRLRGATGAPAARQRTALAADGTVSRPERALAAALRAAGLTQVTAGVRVLAGDRWCWLDFAVEARKLAIEVDGISAHSDPATFHDDRDRQNALILAGWTVLRFTPWQIRTDLPGVLRQISAALSRIG